MGGSPRRRRLFPDPDLRTRLPWVRPILAMDKAGLAAVSPSAQCRFISGCRDSDIESRAVDAVPLEGGSFLLQLDPDSEFDGPGNSDY